MILNSEAAQTDKRGRRYLAFYNKTIAEIIDRTPSTVAQSLALWPLPASCEWSSRDSISPG